MNYFLFLKYRVNFFSLTDQMEFGRIDSSDAVSTVEACANLAASSALNLIAIFSFFSVRRKDHFYFSQDEPLSFSLSVRRTDHFLHNWIPLSWSCLPLPMLNPVFYFSLESWCVFLILALSENKQMKLKCIDKLHVLLRMKTEQTLDSRSTM